jgi:hypothetical protein
MVQLLLQGIGEIVLFPEEDDSTFGNYTTLSQESSVDQDTDILVMARSRISSSALGAFRRSSTILTFRNSRPMTGVVSS